MDGKTEITHTEESQQSDQSQVNQGQTVAVRKKTDIINVLLLVACIVLAVIIVVKVFFVTTVKVSQTSMYDTLNDGDVVVVSKVSAVQRGDIVVFFEEDVTGFFQKLDDSNKKLIKRVVAVAGDEIWVENVTADTYKVMVRCHDTGEVVEEHYTYKGNEVNIPNIGRAYLERLSECVGEENAYTVPEGYFFAMGDNRNNSRDSRNSEVGDISYSKVFGVVIK